jgi:hypothetical protein
MVAEESYIVLAKLPKHPVITDAYAKMRRNWTSNRRGSMMITKKAKVTPNRITQIVETANEAALNIMTETGTTKKKPTRRTIAADRSTLKGAVL